MNVKNAQKARMPFNKEPCSLSDRATLPATKSADKQATGLCRAISSVRKLAATLLQTGLVVLAVSASVAAAPPSKPESPRPNILLILCDDLGYSDLGCYGGEIRTPHLDRLAREGMRFSQFYNCAVCVTTRSALLTGLHPRHGKGPRLRTNMVTLGEVLQDAGYATALTGKWHLGTTAPHRPIDRGFAEYYGLQSGCSSFFNPAKRDPVFYNGGKYRFFAHNEKQITRFPKDFYATDAFTDHAIATIDRLAQGDRPFFVHLCYTAPHFPLHALPEDIRRYRGKYSAGYDALRKARFERQQRIGLFARTPRLSEVDRKTGSFRYDYDVTPWEKLDAATRKREEERMEVYAAMVDRMDQGIGRVLAALKKNQVADNTIVLFLSDNGGCASWPPPAREAGFVRYNHGIPVGDPRGYEFVGKAWGWAQNAPFRRHKVWTYEGGIATPMIVRWPGVTAPGSITHQVGHIVDFLPTLLELAGGDYPRKRNGQAILPVEGKSLTPIFRGKQRVPHASLSWALMGNRAIRQGDWKAVWGASDKRWELYNLKEDRSETVNLASKYPRQLTALAEDWRRWSRTVGLGSSD